MRPPIEFKWRGNHHLYHGLWFIGFGLFNWYMGVDNYPLDSLIPVWQGMVGIGAFMVVDDVIEHWVTGDTPLRLLYEHIILPMLKGGMK